MLNVLAQQMPAVQIVDRDVEEALVLRVVQIHRDYMIRTGTSKEISDQRPGLRDPLLVAPLRLEVHRRHAGGRDSGHGRRSGGLRVRLVKV